MENIEIGKISGGNLNTHFGDLMDEDVFSNVAPRFSVYIEKDPTQNMWIYSLQKVKHPESDTDIEELHDDDGIKGLQDDNDRDRLENERVDRDGLLSNLSPIIHWSPSP